MLSSNVSDVVSTTNKMRGTVGRSRAVAASAKSASQFATAFGPPRSLTKQQITLEKGEKTRAHSVALTFRISGRDQDVAGVALLAADGLGGCD